MGFWKTLTGAEVLQRVAEYTDTVGTVLLGVRADVQTQQKQVEALQQRSEEHSRRIDEQYRRQQEDRERIDRLEEQLRRAIDTWQAAVQDEVNRRLKHAEGELQAFINESLSKAREKLLHDVLSQVQQHMQRQDTLISQLQKQCLIAYLLSVIVGVVVWILK